MEFNLSLIKWCYASWDLVACCCGEAGSWKTPTPFILKIQSTRRPQRIKSTSAGTTALMATPIHRYSPNSSFWFIYLSLEWASFASFFCKSLIFLFFPEASCQSWWWVMNFNIYAKTDYTIWRWRNKLNKWTSEECCCIRGHQITFLEGVPAACWPRLIHCWLLGNPGKQSNLKSHWLVM